MYTERREIEDEIHFIRKQIDFLWERKTELRKRLREIDERDMGKDHSYDAMNSLTNSLTDVVTKLSDLVPPVQVSQVIDHISKDVDKDQIIPSAEDSEKELATKKIEIASKMQQEAKPTIKLSRERACSLIKEILVNKGGPMKFADIEQEFYNQTNKKFANFYEQVKFAMQKFPKIKKIGRGVYTYELDPPKYEESTQEEQRQLMAVAPL